MIQGGADPLVGGYIWKIDTSTGVSVIQGEALSHPGGCVRRVGTALTN